ncbi:MAG: nucleoside triphosphate pyrophosphohydrolase [Anaerolineae bacterium]|nr:nucleoside triphosphate pyrophosphohydrolase [Anaerolineae bacterium]
MNNERMGNVMAITIVGFGPGDPEQVTLEARQVLQAAAEVLVWPGMSDALPEGPLYRPLISEPGEDSSPEALVEQAAEAVCAGSEGGVVVAVPGSPYVLNPVVARVQALASARQISLRIISGLSFIEPALVAAGADPAQALQIFGALEVAGMYHPPFNPDVPVLLAPVSSPALATRLKRVLLNQMPASQSVRLIHNAGTQRQRVAAVPLGELDAEHDFTPTTVLYIPPISRLGSFESLQEVMAHLRSPEGCPWDREQDHLTLRPYLLEEAYEVLDALDRGDLNGLAEELGDLLLQVAFHVQVAVDAGEFHMTDVIAHITHKLIHRHPHVWGDVDVNDSGEVTRNWEAIKKQERRDNGKARASLLDGVSKALPALAQAYNYQARAARVGFDWDQIEPVIDKIREEIDEIQAAEDADHRAREIGDLLFALVNWTRWMDVEPETALREANQRFYRRFHYIEQAADAAGQALSSMTLEEMDALWDEAKARGF